MRLLREELTHLHEPGSNVGEVVKAMGKTKLLVKVILLFCTYVVIVLLIHCYILNRLAKKANMWWN